MNKVLVMSKRISKGGRKRIKMILLTIHEEGEMNRNGITWVEQYVIDNLDSVKGIPICASFLDEEKNSLLDHGYTETVELADGISEPLFLNSESVGFIEDAKIEDVIIDDVNKRVLVGYGYLFCQRYPKLCEKIAKDIEESCVKSSIEIMGKDEHNRKIIYDGGYQEFGRKPQIFDFTGTCLLGVLEADENCYVLEVAQKKDKEEDNKMEFDMNEVKKVITDTINELNSKEAQFETKMTELNSQLEAKNTVIAEKDTELCAKEETIVELNATIEQIKQALQDMETERDAWWAEREALTKQLGELKAKERLGELNSAIECFTEEEKKYAESEINSFNENPEKGDIDAIVSKIYSGIGQASKKASEEAKIAEQNSKNDPTVEDIFSEVCSVKTTEEEIDDNIF